MTNKTGIRIRELREGRDISQQELADMLGINRVAISKWETGVASPTYQRIKRLSDIFNVSTDYLLCATDDKQEQPVIQNHVVNVDDFLNHTKYRCGNIIYDLADEDKQLFRDAIETALLAATAKEEKRRKEKRKEQKRRCKMTNDKKT